MFRYHSWIGFKLNILMFFICLTGALATISHELDWLLISNMRVDAQPKEIAWQAMYENARIQAPDAILRSINAPDYANFAAIGHAVDPYFGSRRLIFNPYTGTLLEERHWYSSAQRILRDVHRYLLYPVVGIYIVGLFGFILLGSTISSLFVYKKWWRGFFTLRVYKGRRIFWGDFHKLIGIWSLWFLLLMGLTGSWYLVEAGIRDFAGINIQMERPRVDAAYLEGIGPAPHIVSINHVLDIVKKEMPSMSVRTISLPVKAGDSYFVSGATTSWWVRDRANHLVINPFNGEVLQKQVAEDQAALNYWVDMADPLHFGNFGGLVVKLVWFLFGLSLPIMSATGTWLWIRRVSKKMKRNNIDPTMAPRAYRLWVLKPLSISIIAIGLSIGAVGITYFTFKSGSPEDMRSLGKERIGPWLVELKVNTLEKEELEKYILSFDCNNCIPNFYQVSIASGFRDDVENLNFHQFERGREPFFGVLSAQFINPLDGHGVTVKIVDRASKVYYAEFFRVDSRAAMRL